MTAVQVVKKSFTNDEGRTIPYQVLAIIGTVQGSTHTLEVKLNKTEAMLAEMLLTSKEKIETTSRKATDDELDDFFKKNKKTDDNQINLEDDD